MKADELKIGNTVKLASGGPPMTVAGILSDGRLFLGWFDQNGNYGTGLFPPEMLTPAPPKGA